MHTTILRSYEKISRRIHGKIFSDLVVTQSTVSTFTQPQINYKWQHEKTFVRLPYTVIENS